MNCGIMALKLYFEEFGIESSEIEKQLQLKINHRGLSVYDLFVCMNEIQQTLVYECDVIDETRCILYFECWYFKHYALLKKVQNRYYYSDQYLKNVKVRIKIFNCLFKKIVIRFL